MKYDNQRKIGGDCFSLNKRKIGKTFFLEELLSKFNLNDYYLIKKTSNFRFLDENEIDKYAGVTFFKKSHYSKDFLERWLDFLKINTIILLYLNKPFPPEYMLEKIKIIDEIQ